MIVDRFRRSAMNRFALLLLLSALLLPAASAHAAPATYDFHDVFKILSGSVVIPPEWDGVWTTQDSLYDCTTGFKQFVSGSDTLCSGQVYTQDSGGNPFNLVCTGTADATSFHATCTGSGDIITDCLLTMEMQIDGTLTANSYRSVTVTNMSYSGTGTGCDLLPASCTRSVIYGTRTGPAPPLYCATPAKRTTWGQLKMSYR
jgi:hypothetical protein